MMKSFHIVNKCLQNRHETNAVRACFVFVCDVKRYRRACRLLWFVGFPYIAVRAVFNGL